MRVQAERRVERRNGDEEDNLGDQRYGPEQPLMTPLMTPLMSEDPSDEQPLMTP